MSLWDTRFLPKVGGLLQLGAELSVALVPFPANLSTFDGGTHCTVRLRSVVTVGEPALSGDNVTTTFFQYCLNVG